MASHRIAPCSRTANKNYSLDPGRQADCWADVDKVRLQRVRIRFSLRLRACCFSCEAFRRRMEVAHGRTQQQTCCRNAGRWEVWDVTFLPDICRSPWKTNVAEGHKGLDLTKKGSSEVVATTHGNSCPNTAARASFQRPSGTFHCRDISARRDTG